MFLLDTNICFALMKNKNPKAAQRLFSCDPTEIAVSSITVYELEYGASKSQWPEKNRTNEKLFLAPFTIIPFDSADAAVAGEIRQWLEQAGTPIGPYDLLIAAQGLARGFTVVTHNTGEFSRVPNLKLTDWLENPETET
ncbi:MAG: type II toxin-antitoxin system VapC family toxin [Acidaminococcaceae bacterium]|nr:type II toxin-antitoxin system VapC family toxin [Acidaminococcaceae bacterium]